MDRRDFIKHSLVTAAASAFASSLPSSFAAASKRIVVLGGTHFLGPAIVEAANGEGHIVTLFNRGVSNATLFPHLEKLRGFRSNDPRDEIDSHDVVEEALHAEQRKRRAVVHHRVRLAAIRAAEQGAAVQVTRGVDYL